MKLHKSIATQLRAQRTLARVKASITALHGDTYDYTKSVYLNRTTKLTITCPIHGDFEQTIGSHLRKTRPAGCPKCSGMYSPTTEEFIQKSKEIHGDLYTYEKTSYVRNNTPVTITCRLHGDFTQLPTNHLLNGTGCNECRSITLSYTTESYIKKASLVHDNKYNYSQTVFSGGSNKISIICPEHGEFFKEASDHLRGRGCNNCSGNVYKHTNESFITAAEAIHGKKYGYNLINFGKSTKVIDKLTFTCSVHGNFKQRGSDHLEGAGCSKCAKSGFNKSKPGMLYYFKVQYSKHTAWKVGITNNSLKDRYTKAERNRISDIISVWYESGEDCYNEEQRILKQYKQYKYTGVPLLTTGNTELFNENIYI